MDTIKSCNLTIEKIQTKRELLTDKVLNGIIPDESAGRIIRLWF